jgi:hypothetical protein
MPAYSVGGSRLDRGRLATSAVTVVGSSTPGITEVPQGAEHSAAGPSRAVRRRRVHVGSARVRQMYASPSWRAVDRTLT